MPINSDYYRPPLAIGQGITPISDTDYDTPNAGSAGADLSQSAGAGPFAPYGPFSIQANDYREGLSRLLQPKSDASLSAISNLWMPSLGGTSVTSLVPGQTAAPVGTSQMGGGLSGAASSASPAPRGGSPTAGGGLGTAESIRNAKLALKLASPGLKEGSKGFDRLLSQSGASIPFSIPSDVLSGASGGSLLASELTSQVPFQIPADVLSGASGGGLVGGGGAAGGWGGIAPYAGAGVAGAGAALTIADLVNALVNDRASEGQIANTGVNLGLSALPILEALIPALSGISGLGLAATPMLIPAIQGIVKMFGDPNLPYNSGNMSQYRSRATADMLPGKFQDWIGKQTDPKKLLGLAAPGAPISPNEEAVFHHGTYGASSSPEYQAALQRVLGGDPQALRDFISGINVNFGETGGTQADPRLTDWYRRSLAHAYGIPQEQTAGLFAPDNSTSLADRLSREIAGYTGSNTPHTQADLENLHGSLAAYADPGYSNFGDYSPLYRDPALGRLTPDQVTTNQAAVQAAINQLYPSEEVMSNDPYLMSLRAAGFNPRGQYVGAGGEGGGEGGGGVMHAGGLIPDTGTNEVNITAMPGEFVLKRPAVQKFGLGRLMTMNDSA